MQAMPYLAMALAELQRVEAGDIVRFSEIFEAGDGSPIFRSKARLEVPRNGLLVAFYLNDDPHDWSPRSPLLLPDRLLELHRMGSPGGILVSWGLQSWNLSFPARVWRLGVRSEEDQVNRALYHSTIPGNPISNGISGA